MILLIDIKQFGFLIKCRFFQKLLIAMKKTIYILSLYLKHIKVVLIIIRNCLIYVLFPMKWIKYIRIKIIEKTDVFHMP